MQHIIVHVRTSTYMPTLDVVWWPWALFIVIAKLNLIENCFRLNLKGSVISSEKDRGILWIKNHFASMLAIDNLSIIVRIKVLKEYNRTILFGLVLMRRYPIWCHLVEKIKGVVIRYVITNWVMAIGTTAIDRATARGPWCNRWLRFAKGWS